MNPFPFLQSRSERQRALTFGPLAWLKLQYFCHAGATEIGGFGVSAPNDYLYVEDFQTVHQRVSPVSVQFDDEAVADFFDGCVDRGLSPDRFARIWCHTHPGASVTPSGTDEDTFRSSFGNCDWAVMFILGRTGQTHARLSFAAGPRGKLLLPVQVDWAAWPGVAAEALSQHLAGWQQEFAANIQPLPPPALPAALPTPEPPPWLDRWDDPEPYFTDPFDFTFQEEEYLHDPFA